MKINYKQNKKSLADHRLRNTALDNLQLNQCFLQGKLQQTATQRPFKSPNDDWENRKKITTKKINRHIRAVVLNRGAAAHKGAVG